MPKATVGRIPKEGMPKDEYVKKWTARAVWRAGERSKQALATLDTQVDVSVR